MKREILLSTILAGVLVTSSIAQEEEINTGQDFTKPLTRFDVRYRYEQLSGSTDSHTTILRMDAPVPLDQGRSGMFYFRADFPIRYSDVPGRDNPNGDYEFGSGDLFTQFVYIPPPQASENLPWDASGYGAALLWPTASVDSFGTEKYVVAPLAGFKWDLNDWTPGSFFTLVGLYYMDYADYSGGDKRDDISELAIRPVIHYMVPKEWGMPFDFVDFWSLEEIKFNFESGTNKSSGDVFIPFDILFGKMLNKKTVVSVEFAAPIYKDSGYDFYDWKLGARIGFFF
ncbi:MAG: hypothetical protein ACYS76_06725 [Planctomycetota bacterium]|jgi:hypothetical protein